MNSTSPSMPHPRPRGPMPDHAPSDLRHEYALVELVDDDVGAVMAGETFGDDGAHAVGAHVGQRHRERLVAGSRHHGFLARRSRACKGRPRPPACMSWPETVAA